MKFERNPFIIKFNVLAFATILALGCAKGTNDSSAQGVVNSGVGIGGQQAGSIASAELTEPKIPDALEIFCSQHFVNKDIWTLTCTKTHEPITRQCQYTYYVDQKSVHVSMILSTNSNANRFVPDKEYNDVTLNKGQFSAKSMAWISDNCTKFLKFR